MGDAADDAEFQEEENHTMFWLHLWGKCVPDCPYCYIEDDDWDDTPGDWDINYF